MKDPVLEALMEVDSWNEPRQWPRPFREVVHYAKVLAAEVHTLKAKQQEVRGVQLAQAAVPSRPQPDHPSGLLRLRDVSKYLGLSRSSVYQYMRKGTFPPPVKLGVRAVRWRATDLEEWISARR